MKDGINWISTHMKDDIKLDIYPYETRYKIGYLPI